MAGTATATANATGAPMGRLHHFDALRSFCMLYGILVHAGTLQPSSALSRVIFETSDHFRMATFFLISGFFAVMVLGRYGTGGFLRHRWTAILVPFLTALVLLNPVTLWLVYLWSSGPISLPDFLAGRFENPERPINWHLHLWFLVSLAVYVGITPLVAPVLRSRPLQALAGGVARLPADLAVIALGLAMVAGEMTGRLINGAAFEPLVGSTEFAWLFRATLQYAPWFLLGALAFTHAGLFAALHRLSLPALAIGAGLKLAEVTLAPRLGGFARTFLEVTSEEFLTFALVAGLMWLFRRLITRETATVKALNGSVYTIYLFHYLLVYAFALTLFRGIEPFPLQFALVAAATFAAGFALDRLAIQRVPLLTFLFNGKRRAAPLSAPRSA